MTNKICVGQNKDGRLEIFYIGTNDRLYHNWQKSPNGVIWNGERDINDKSNYPTAKQICVGENKDGRLEIFYIRMNDDRLCHNWQKEPGGEWSGEYESYDGSNYYTAKQICVYQNIDGRLDIFYIATNDRLYYNWQVSPNSVWKGHAEFKNGSHYYTAKQICVYQNIDGRLEIFYIGTNDRLYHNWQKSLDGGWHGEEEFKHGGHYYTAKQICVGRNYDGRLEIFYIGTNDRLYHNWQEKPNGGWHGEEEFKDGSHYYAAKQICVGQNVDGRLEIFYIATNDRLYHNWQEKPNGHWNGEMPLVEVYTVCFCGTSCTRDEGEETRPASITWGPGSDKRIYCDETGYIPVRIHKEISGSLKATKPSVTVRGVSENDWSEPRNKSEPLIFNRPLNAHKSLIDYVKSYSGGDQRSRPGIATGWAAPALALHGANLAAARGAQQYNFIGHSRGAVECIMAAWFLYAYGSEEIRQIPVNIFTIDPVPGPGNWYGILTQLPPNVVNYVGVYAWDVCGDECNYDSSFMALVPRPNGRMTEKDNNVIIPKNSDWKYIADNAQLTDPLASGNFSQPLGYKLYACRGRHSTVAGCTTADGWYDYNKRDGSVAPVPQLIYKIARAYLTKWGTIFPIKSAVVINALELRKKIHTEHSKFDAMGGGIIREATREISSIKGRDSSSKYRMEDVAGHPSSRMTYPVTKDCNYEKTGWVKWKFL